MSLSFIKYRIAMLYILNIKPIQYENSGMMSQLLSLKSIEHVCVYSRERSVSYTCPVCRTCIVSYTCPTNVELVAFPACRKLYRKRLIPYTFPTHVLHFLFAVISFLGTKKIPGMSLQGTRYGKKNVWPRAVDKYRYRAHPTYFLDLRCATVKKTCGPGAVVYKGIY